jgi:hypothetical protein
MVAHRMPLSPAPAATTPPTVPRTTIEILVSQRFEGVAAEGTRTVYLGRTDSDPRALTVERWESPELKITLATKSSNGYGTELAHLSRTEPDPALFQPPSAYRIVDEKDRFPMVIQVH